METNTLIQIQSVSKHYGAIENGVLALQNVSLSVHAGEFLSIIGPSGCGKSTLLKLIADLLAPNHGYISINAHSPHDARRARQCGIVFQSPTLMEWRSIERNIELPLEIIGTPHNERAQRVNELLDLIRLREFASRYPHELSIGMQQQVAIARAMAHRPSILLMDEPFGALDEMTRERLGRELLGLWERTHVTIIFVTHSISEAVFLSDRVAVFTPRPGQIARVINIDLPRPRTIEMRESLEFIAHLRLVRTTLRAHGGDWE